MKSQKIPSEVASILVDYIQPITPEMLSDEAGQVIEYSGDDPPRQDMARLRWYMNMIDGPPPAPNELLEIKRIKKLEALSREINDGGGTIWHWIWAGLKAMMKDAIAYWRS